MRIQITPDTGPFPSSVPAQTVAHSFTRSINRRISPKCDFVCVNASRGRSRWSVSTSYGPRRLIVPLLMIGSNSLPYRSMSAPPIGFFSLITKSSRTYRDEW